MALDEPTDKDERIDIDGFTYVIDKTFLDKVQPIRVDFNSWGFHLSCAVDFTAGGSCSGCGTTKNCCSTH